MKAEDNGSSRRERRHFSAAQKVAIVKRHLIDGVPASDRCQSNAGAIYVETEDENAQNRTFLHDRSATVDHRQYKLSHGQL